MKIIGVPILFAIILVVGSFITAFFQHPEASASAASLVSTQSRNRNFHFVQECSEYKETPGSFCTIASSDLAAVPTGSKIFYVQSPITSIGLLDSNIVLDAGQGNRGVGRCTLDWVSRVGLCTISDGIGKLAGLQARVDVSGASGDPIKLDWRGTYSYPRDDVN